MDLYKQTYQSNPELWDEGLSFLVKVEYENGAQASIASGWHLRQIDFEHPNFSITQIDDQIGLIVADGGAVDTSSYWASVSKFEAEISLAEGMVSQAKGLLSKFVDSKVAAAMVYSMQDMNMRVSANRSDAIVVDDIGLEIPSADFLCQNLPARSGDMEEPLRILSRWCRVFSYENGTITIYQPIEEDEKANLRWPHNCIWLNRPDDYFLHKTAIGEIKEAIRLPLAYESYNLDNWAVEYALWENKLLQLMLQDGTNNISEKFLKVQHELGILSQFVATASLSTRNLKRRTDNNRLVNSNQDVLKLAQQHHEEQLRLVQKYRQELRYASELLANSAQSVQAMVDQERAKIAEQTNTIITFASVLFLVPTLIISFFSMTIIGPESDLIEPSTMFVLTLCLSSILATLVLLILARLITKKLRNKSFNSRRLRCLNFSSKKKLKSLSKK